MSCQSPACCPDCATNLLSFVLWQGQGFVFDKGSVAVNASSSTSSSNGTPAPLSTAGSASYQASTASITPSPCVGVSFQGTWLGDGHRYRLVMEPDYSMPQSSSNGGGSSNRSSQISSRTTSYQTRSNGSSQSPSQQRNQNSNRPAARGVRVTAQPLPQLNTGVQLPSTSRGRADVGPSPALIASELTAFFNGLTLDLQGAEMKFESMSVQQSSRWDLRCMHVCPYASFCLASQA